MFFNGVFGKCQMKIVFNITVFSTTDLYSGVGKMIKDGTIWLGECDPLLTTLIGLAGVGFLIRL